MSASLVGSEMCIRDRNLNCADPREASNVHPARPRPAGSPSESDGADETAVSYTHLTLPTICSV
eukprot:5699289-Alexandrium_andersonii.AAC.1